MSVGAAVVDTAPAEIVGVGDAGAVAVGLIVAVTAGVFPGGCCAAAQAITNNAPADAAASQPGALTTHLRYWSDSQMCSLRP